MLEAIKNFHASFGNMQNVQIRLLISVMAISLLGLIFLQYKWIREAIAVKEAFFNHTVNEALEKVAYKMEKLEAAQIMWKRYGPLSNQDNKNFPPPFSPQLTKIDKITGDSLNSDNTVIINKTISGKIGGAFLGVLMDIAPEELGPGVLVAKVIEDSPAEAAGLKEGDIITAIDSVRVFTALEVQRVVSNHTAGDEVAIRYKRPRILPPQTLIAETTIVKPFDGTKQTTDNEVVIRKMLSVQQVPSDSSLLWFENMDTTALATLATKMEQTYQHIQSLATEMLLLKKPIKDRFDRKALEATIKANLNNAGIDTPYEYCLRSGEECATNSNVVYANCKFADLSPELLNTPYRKMIGQGAVFAPTAELLLYFPNKQQLIWNSSVFMLGSSLLFNLLILGVFTYTMLTIIRQKKLSDMKTDFINNMTHELKTPISTIKLACEMLTDKSVPKTESRIDRYASMIQEENYRLQDHVERVLQYARLDKGNLKLNLSHIDMRDVLNDVAQKTMLQVAKLTGNIHTVYEAENTKVNGDLMHLTNVVYNLLDNAVKYAKPDVPPEITISTYNVDNQLVIAVTDNGIGMTKETQSKIFEQFYRVPTGNIHNVKGFGLGLSYAKLMTEQHGGYIRVSSKLGKGSTFELHLPLEQ